VEGRMYSISPCRLGCHIALSLFFFSAKQLQQSNSLYLVLPNI
jgi:hypothetical protein